MKDWVLVSEGSWQGVVLGTLQMLGGKALALSPDQDLEAQYAQASHVLLLGGADVHPAHYGQVVTWAQPRASLRDAVELQLAAWALRDGKPLMGICRGHQVITVAAGGSLWQDIAEETGVSHCARQHWARFAPFSRLVRYLGVECCYSVNSFHHQAVKRVPRGWYVAAESLTGIVEAIEHPTLPVISVQWHPEVLGDGASARLFTAFLNLEGI